MLAVTTPNAPTFSEHFNPALLIGVLTTNPTTGKSYEFRMTIQEYFTDHLCDDLYNGGNPPLVADLLKAFDINGYYATSWSTIFPLTDNVTNS